MASGGRWPEQLANQITTNCTSIDAALCMQEAASCISVYFASLAVVSDSLGAAQLQAELETAQFPAKETVAA